MGLAIRHEDANSEGKQEALAWFRALSDIDKGNAAVVSAVALRLKDADPKVRQQALVVLGAMSDKGNAAVISAVNVCSGMQIPRSGKRRSSCFVFWATKEISRGHRLRRGELISGHEQIIDRFNRNT